MQATQFKLVSPWTIDPGFFQVQHHLPAVNRVAQDFVNRLTKIRYAQNNEVNDLTTEIGRWSIENAGARVFDKRIGCFDFGSEAEEFSRKMIDSNRIVFKFSGLLKLSFPFYKVRQVLFKQSLNSSQSSKVVWSHFCISRNISNSQQVPTNTSWGVDRGSSGRASF